MRSEKLFSNEQLKALIIPLLIEQLLAVTVGFADTIMVSNVGEAAVSAVSLVDSINILLINVFSALATGGAVVVAQFIGQNDNKKALISAKQLVFMTAFFSSIIMVISLCFRTSILSFIFGKVEADVMSNALIYFLFSAFSYPFIALYNSGAALFRAMGNSKISMVNSFIMNVINVILNAVFIFGCHMGVLGAVIATLIARFTGCIVILTMLKNKDNDIYIDNYSHIEIKLDYMKKILAIGIPSGLENGMFQIGKILVQSLVASLGTYAIAANAVSNNLCQMMIIPGTAIGLAMVTVVGQCIGAREYEQARFYVKKLMKMTFICMGVLCLLIAFIAPYVFPLYSLSAQTTDLAYKCIWLHAIFGIFVWPLSFTLPNALRAANDAKYTMIVSIVSMWTFRYCFSFFLARNLGFGLVGVWMAMIIDWFVRSIFFIYRYVSNKWMNKQLV